MSRLTQACVLAAPACLLFLAGCKPVGPNYKRPEMTAPAAYKEAGSAVVSVPPSSPDGNGWKPASPSDGMLRGKWWELYQDAQLNQLEERVTSGNQALKAALENYQAAHTLVAQNRAGLFPTISAGPSVSRTRYGKQSASYNSTRNYPYNDFALKAQASWEPDLWGSVRRSVESAQASAQVTAALAANVDLSLHAELAVDYFTLRGLDAEERMLRETVASLEKQLALTETRRKGGVGTEADVAQARTQLETVRAQLVEVGVARAQNEHAIAYLCGSKPAELSLPPSPLDSIPATQLPKIPLGVPSQILERRPDIAAAERNVAVANAQIGIAKSAYYPNISLSASGGFESMKAGSWIEGPGTLWSLGASATELLFDAGRRKAVNEEARHSYEAEASSYRDTVLAAFEDVENQLSTLRVLEQEAEVEARAVASAQHSLDVANERYKGGVTNYLEVIEAEYALLNNQRTQIDLESRRFVASANLIRSLGGGWDSSQLPSEVVAKKK